ncbi:hypothetical protein FUAX_16240 [Fulvitalea axinellae]|uniref:DUF5683 domain-containing protein n=1 Tax=Fulvitalea axinellae TaxID=1182444 RepID=A0AAU9CMQ4_9BACT|nr:hypothetical protein FUAX_16240 [Fulvitalea axinellae]
MMRKRLLLVLGVMVLLTVEAYAQKKKSPETEKEKQELKDYTPEELDELRRIPGRAALYSAVLPGLGQAYNKKFWKIPIIYAGGAVFGYFIGYNDLFYQRARNALFQERYYGENDLNPNLSEQQLENLTNRYRRNRDYMIIFSVLWYSANIIDAYVDAHLRDFDVSKNLSLKIAPTLEYTANNQAFIGAGIQLKF